VFNGREETVCFAGCQCEGKPYNDRSDVWALGCILYEMACLQKTFEGSNLPALVNKIMKVCIGGTFSQGRIINETGEAEASGSEP